MHLHGFSVGARQNQSGAFVAGRADGAEEVGPSGALVMRLVRPRTLLDPLIDETFFWPTRASSWNQISTGVPGGSS
jgi:hypothetical protein